MTALLLQGDPRLRYLLLVLISPVSSVLLPIMLHEVVGVGKNTSVGLGLAAAFVFNFTMFRRYVFQSRGGVKGELVRFGAVSAIFRGLEYCGFLLLSMSAHLNYVFALCVVLGLSLALKYFCYAAFVFRGPHPPNIGPDGAPTGVCGREQRT